ncbi:MAG: hypothetical protein SFT68_05155 [Rickettsiaceae bacterium]|nr:hypothetical protein [Rickettsiaceae bacterium]
MSSPRKRDPGDVKTRGTTICAPCHPLERGDPGDGKTGFPPSWE